MDLCSLYAVNSLFWMLMKTVGENPQVSILKSLRCFHLLRKILNPKFRIRYSYWPKKTIRKMRIKHGRLLCRLGRYPVGRLLKLKTCKCYVGLYDSIAILLYCTIREPIRLLCLLLHELIFSWFRLVMLRMS